MQMDLHQPAQDNVQKNLWKQITLYLLTLGIIGICFFIIYPFLSGIIGAIVLAVITTAPLRLAVAQDQEPQPLLRDRSRPRHPQRHHSQLLHPAGPPPGNHYRSHLSPQRRPSTRPSPASLEAHPTIAAEIHVVSNTIDIQNTVRSIAAILGNLLASFLSYSLGATTQLVIMLFILFFLYRDQEVAISFARSLLPLSDQETDHLLDNMGSTINATALGRLVIGIIQGVLAGLAFWVLGVPNTMLWTAVTIVASILPAVGASIVWIPVAVYLGFTGHLGQGRSSYCLGTFVVSSIDNFLYPVLVGSKLNQHTVSVLLAILGGVVIFGFSGVILGPLAFTIATTLLDFWRRRNNEPRPSAYNNRLRHPTTLPPKLSLATPISPKLTAPPRRRTLI